MALTEQVQLDIQNAQRQITALEQQLAGLGTPVNVPVDIAVRDQGLDSLQAELRRLDTQDVDIDVDVGDVARAEREFSGLSREVDDTADQLQRVAREANDANDAMLRVGTRGASAFTNLRGSLLGVAAGFAAFQGGQQVLDFLNQSIDAASDLEESTSKAQVVFGSFFDDIDAFASTAPQALGLANSAALEFTGTFGNLFTALGLSQQAAADLAPEIVQLGSDLASFNNIDVTEALEKLRSGLVGEAEPLRALGVNITAATTQAKALELGLGGLTGELTEAEKVQARYALILEQTTNAQGDFARTADGIANRQRTLNAEFENFRAAVGQALLPVFEDLLDAAQDLLPRLVDLAPAFGNVAEGVVEMVGPVIEILGPLAELAGLLNSVKTSAQGLAQSENPFDRLLGDTVDDLTTGALPALLGNLEEVRFFLETGFPLDVLRGQVQDFHAAIDEGANAERNLIRFLQNITSQGTLTESTLAAIVDGLELTAAEAAGIRIGAREGLFGDLSPAEIDVINEALERFLDIDSRFQGRRTGAGADIVPDFGRFPDDLDDIAGGLENVETGIQRVQFERIISGFSAAEQSAFRLRGSLLGVFDVDTGTSDLEADVNEILGLFDALPSAFDAARTALRNDQGDIIEDFSTFGDNLIAELEAQAAFRENILTLRALGFDDLADQFAALGIESAAALADGLTDPAELARIEAALDQTAAAIDENIAGAIAESVLSATNDIDELIAAIQAIDGLTATAQIQVLFEAIGAIDSRPSFEENIGQGGPPPTSTVTNNTTVNIASPDVPTSTITRTTQAINSVVAAPE